METMSYTEMCAYCASMRDTDRFCRVSSACSGPGYSNLACDYGEGAVPGCTHFRGGNHGSCHFLVRDDEED